MHPWLRSRCQYRALLLPYLSSTANAPINICHVCVTGLGIPLRFPRFPFCRWSIPKEVAPIQKFQIYKSDYNYHVPTLHASILLSSVHVSVCSQVTLDRSIVGYPALIGMTDFSHVWLVFVFHDNTNATVNGVVEERPAADADAASAAASNGGHVAGEGKGPQDAVAENGEGGGGDTDADRWGGGAREYRSPKHKLRQTFLTKVW